MLTFEEFDVHDADNISLKWTKWLFRIEKYMNRQRIINDDDKILELFLHGGYDLEQLYHQYTTPDQQQDTYEMVIKKINDHLNPQASVHLNKYQFRQIKQNEGESFNELVQRVREAAKQCKFQPDVCEDECVSQMIQACESKSLRMKALNSKRKLTMRDIIDMGRLDENVNAYVSAVPSISTASVNTIGQNMPCRNCGFNLPHKSQSGECPAKGKECAKCGKPNHFAKVCRSQSQKGCDSSMRGGGGGNHGSGSSGHGRNESHHSGNGNRHGGNGNRHGGNSNRHGGNSGHGGNGARSGRGSQDNRDHESHGIDDGKRVGKVNFDMDSDDSEGMPVWAILRNIKERVSRAFMPSFLLFLLQTSITFYLDTGTSVDVLDEHTYMSLTYKPKLEPTTVKLYGYGGGRIKVLGTITTRVKCGNNGRYRSLTLFVTSGKDGNLLTYQSALMLEAMAPVAPVRAQVNATTSKTAPPTNKWKAQYPGVFSERVGLHKHFEAELHIDESVTPKREKLRHVPFNLRTQVEREIMEMLDNDLIEPVPGPTPWVSPIVIVPKRNGTDEIRICTDARQANKAIKRERHITPTVDDIIVRLNGAQVISKLDLKKGYHQIPIAEHCRYITAFCTHLGIFQYK